MEHTAHSIFEIIVYTKAVNITIYYKLQKSTHTRLYI